MMNTNAPTATVVKAIDRLQRIQPVTEHTRAVLAHGQVPYLIPGLGQATFALRNLAWWSQVTGSPGKASAPADLPVPARGERRGEWSEDAARRLLSEAGLPVIPARLVTSSDDAVKAAAEIGGPVAVKVVSPGILHKSDIGGVRLGVPADEDAIRDAYLAVTAAATAAGGVPIDGVLISPMRHGGTELLVGVLRDPHWGPMLAVAIGGVFVEVLADSALAPLPVTPAQAGHLLQKLRGQLDGRNSSFLCFFVCLFLFLDLLFEGDRPSSLVQETICKCPQLLELAFLLGEGTPAFVLSAGEGQRHRGTALGGKSERSFPH